jgi:hypothetical protein
LSTFLGSVECPEVCEQPDCTLEQYEACSSVQYKNLKLIDSGEGLLKLSSIYQPFIKALVFQVDRYFPPDSLKAFDVLLPINFPSTQLALDETYGEGGIVTLCSVLGWNDAECATVKKDFSTLIMAIISSSDWVLEKNSDPALFWATSLSQSSLPWTQAMRNFIKQVLCLPHGSALAEMGFSFMSKTLGSNRQNLEPTSMDNILRLKLNGPAKMSELNVKKYVNKWLYTHKRSDAPENVGGRPRVVNPIRRPKLPSSTLF